MHSWIQLTRNYLRKMFSHHKTPKDLDIMPEVYRGLDVLNIFLQKPLGFSHRVWTRLKLKLVIVSRRTLRYDILIVLNIIFITFAYVLNATFAYCQSGGNIVHGP